VLFQGSKVAPADPALRLLPAAGDAAQCLWLLPLSREARGVEAEARPSPWDARAGEIHPPSPSSSIMSCTQLKLRDLVFNRLASPMLIQCKEVDS
jgi:hypothetical protein